MRYIPGCQLSILNSTSLCQRALLHKMISLAHLKDSWTGDIVTLGASETLREGPLLGINQSLCVFAVDLHTTTLIDESATAPSTGCEHVRVVLSCKTSR